MAMQLVRWLSKESSERADIAVLIVSWNVKDLVLGNLEALFLSEGDISAQVILVDNASADGTVEEVQKRFPAVRVIANDRNQGFARANMHGMLAMSARHVLLLNPDMRAAPDALTKTVAYLDAHPEAAVVSGKLTSIDGATVRSVRRFPSVWSQLAVLFKLPRLFTRIIDRYLCVDVDLDKEQKVDSVRGAYFAINRTALEATGGLDTRYFIWFEDVDYCKAVKRHGFEVMHVPTIQATDLLGRSFAKRQLYWKQKMFSRSMAQYFAKWHPGWRARLIAVAAHLILPFVWLAERIFMINQKP